MLKGTKEKMKTDFLLSYYDLLLARKLQVDPLKYTVP